MYTYLYKYYIYLYRYKRKILPRRIFRLHFTATGQKLPGQKPPDNKPPKIFEEIIAKYAVDANLSASQ